MKWQQLILAFIATVCLIFAGNALAQTDININNTNLVRFGGDVSVPANQTVENASAFGGNVTVLPNARVLDTASLFQRGYANAFGGDIILKAGARVDGDAYSFGGKIVQEPGAIIGGEKATFSDRQVLALIPFFGGLVVFSINLFGLGVILLWKFGRSQPQMVV
jgi:hypothetical protein